MKFTTTAKKPVKARVAIPGGIYLYRSRTNEHTVILTDSGVGGDCAVVDLETGELFDEVFERDLHPLTQTQEAKFTL